MTDVAIKVESLSKAYRLGSKENINDTFVANLWSWVNAPVKNFKKLQKLTHFDKEEKSEDVLWALNKVSFEVKRGEIFGIIGRNGAGKSTLLKILSRITEPTSGGVEINGRVASLLEVGTGFHPELTGRENVYMNGTILGMSKKEIDLKFDEIIDFSGVEKFLDTPLKRYSTGMKVRLAFSVAAFLEPEILIIDEVLAVGDSSFQDKCLGRMREIGNEGRTVIFVSHQLEAVSSLCSCAMLLKDGETIKIDKPDNVISDYLFEVKKSNSIKTVLRTDREGEGRIKITDIWLENKSSNRINIIPCGDCIKFIVEYRKKSDENVRGLSVGIAIYSNKNIPIALLDSKITNNEFEALDNNLWKIECIVEKNILNVGDYYINLSLHSSGVLEDWIKEAFIFTVSPSDYYGTGKIPDQKRLVLLDYRWNLIK